MSHWLPAISAEPPMFYHGAIFDMGDIFFDATPWRRWLAAQLVEIGLNIDYSRLVPLWEIALLPVYVGRQSYWDAFREFLRSLGLLEAQIETVEAAAKLKAHHVERRQLYDGVATTLAQLNQAGVRMAVLSDTESAETRVRERLADLGIERYFTAVVTSRDIGYVKPQLEAYHAALGRLGLEKQDVVFVGHDIDELEGAIAFGITAVAYNAAPEAPANHYLSHFSELTQLMHQGRLRLR